LSLCASLKAVHGSEERGLPERLGFGFHHRDAAPLRHLGQALLQRVVQGDIVEVTVIVRRPLRTNIIS